MASIRRRKHSWQARVRRHGASIARTFDTRAAAEHWARQVEAAMDLGRFQAPSHDDMPTLAEALERYGKEVTRWKRSAQREYTRIRMWQRDPLAKRPLNAIRPADLAAWRDRRLADGRATNTVRLDLALISHLYRVAELDWGYEGLRNPARAIRMPPPSRARNRRLRRCEEALLLKLARSYENPELLAAIRLAIETGMRQGEILSLQWEHVDLDHRVAWLPVTKNGESRAVPLSRKAVRALARLARAKGLRPPLRGEVFEYTGAGFRLTWSRLLRRARRAHEDQCHARGEPADPAMFADLRFHDLRHEATSRLFEKGLNTMQVAAVTGHKTLTMLRRYTHLRARDIAMLLD